jgi:hypothetical protein
MAQLVHLTDPLQNGIRQSNSLSAFLYLLLPAGEGGLQRQPHYKKRRNQTIR